MGSFLNCKKTFLRFHFYRFLCHSSENWFVGTLSSINVYLEEMNLGFWDGQHRGLSIRKSLKMGMKIDRKSLNICLPLKFRAARPVIPNASYPPPEEPGRSSFGKVMRSGPPFPRGHGPVAVFFVPFPLITGIKICNI